MKRKDIGELLVEKAMRKKFNKVHPSTTIKKLVELFHSPRINSVPVFDRKSNFIGEVHQLDLLKLIVDPTKIPNEEIISMGFDIDFGYFAKTAKDVMRRHEITLEKGDKLQEAAYAMRKEGVTTIPIVENGKVVGLLTSQDLLDMVLKAEK